MASAELAPPSKALRRTAMVLGWLAIVTGGSWLVHDSEAQRRGSADARLTARAQTSAHSIEAHVDDAFRRHRYRYRHRHRHPAGPRGQAVPLVQPGR